MEVELEEYFTKSLFQVREQYRASVAMMFACSQHLWAWRLPQWPSSRVTETLVRFGTRRIPISISLFC